MKLIADNLRITKPDIRDALIKKDPEPIRDLVKKCAKSGAHAIDVNTGPLGKDPKEGMEFFIRAVESVTDLPILIDTANPKAMRAGLEAARNKVIMNGFSLEPKRLQSILPLAKEFNTDIIGFLLYPDSRVPQDEAGRYDIALALMDRAEEAGVAKERVIIDPVVPPLTWQDGIIQARAALKAIQGLPELLGFPVRTIAGVSNLCTGSGDRDKRQLMEQNYVAMLAFAGLSFALLDVLDPNMVRSARASGILAGETLFSWGMVPV